MVSLMEETPEDTEAPRDPARPRTRQNGKAIRALRELSGYSQTKFAARVGIAQGTLSGIERETDNASLTVLVQIARKLPGRVPVDAIMRDPDADPEEDAPGEAEVVAAL
jgi:transcriptional regulator with XRE-family HTH domain